MGIWIDPVDYVHRWAITTPIDVPLSSESDYTKVALASHAILLFDNPLAQQQPKRLAYRFVREQLDVYADMIETWGFVLTTKILKDMSAKFLDGFVVANGHVSFNMHEDLLLSPLYRAMRVFDDGFDEQKLDLLRFIFTWHVYLSKLPLTRPDLLDSSETDWIDRQVKPLPLHASSFDIDGVSRIVNWLIDFQPSFIGNHGPGSTAGGFNTVATKNAAYKPTLQSRLLTKYDVDMIPYVLGSVQPNELIFVNKDMGSLRPITPEPVETQFAQQGLKFDWYINTDQSIDNPVRHFIRYGDQSLSQRCAIIGSRVVDDETKPSTIDLSAASDRLSVDLVTMLFKGDLLHYIMLARSRETNTSRGTIELNMYGGMGSALTFPVQSTIFCALAIWATVVRLYEIENGVKPIDVCTVLTDYLDSDGFRPQFSRVQRSVRVYGDDICVPDFAAKHLIKLLSEFGLSVNVAKSFTGNSPVRESCGVYAFAGYDITPKRYRLPVVRNHSLVDASHFEGARQFCNDSFLRGYRHLYRFGINYVKSCKLFISRKELSRNKLAGKRITSFSGLSRYPSQSLGAPGLLFEAYRGKDDYIGFISIEDSIPSIPLALADRTLGFTTYAYDAPRLKDVESEYYHLTVDYRLMTTSDAHTEAHGSIPRGVRLVKRNAIILRSPKDETRQVWGWAPR